MHQFIHLRDNKQRLTFNIPEDATLEEIIAEFELYLKACEYVFNGHLEIVTGE